MVDTVTVENIYDGVSSQHLVRHITNRSDGTGENAVVKVDASTFAMPDGSPVEYFNVQRIEFSVWGFNYVAVEFNATSNDEIAVLQGQGEVDWSQDGGKVDPQSAGSNGDILVTTNGGAAGSGYDITMWLKKKAN